MSMNNSLSGRVKKVLKHVDKTKQKHKEGDRDGLGGSGKENWPTWPVASYKRRKLKVSKMTPLGGS